MLSLSSSSSSRQPKTAYLGWSGLNAAANVSQVGDGVESVEVDPEVAMSLGWSEGILVSYQCCLGFEINRCSWLQVEIAVIHNPLVAKSVSVTPMSPDDWEILVSYSIPCRPQRIAETYHYRRSNMHLSWRTTFYPNFEQRKRDKKLTYGWWVEPKSEYELVSNCLAVFHMSWVPNFFRWNQSVKQLSVCGCYQTRHRNLRRPSTSLIWIHFVHPIFPVLPSNS